MLSKTDGYLKIKTKLDNSGIDKDVAELENKINKLEMNSAENSAEQELLQRELDQYEELKNKANSYKQKLKELKLEKEEIFKANPGLAVSAETAEYSNIKMQISDIQAKYKQINAEIDKQAPKIDKTAMKLEKLKAKQSENNAKISQFKDKIEAIKINKIQSGIDGIGSGLQKTIGKIGKMALAFWGVRAGINAVRSAMSTMAQYNPQIAADIDYIKYALANTLLPVLQTLINFATTLLRYINAITSAWFGINLFSNSSAKNFQKMQNSASGTAKSMKEAEKSLQGFDEKNVLQDNSDSGSSGGGAVAPSFDLSNMSGEVPGWLQWIIDNGDIVLKILEGIVSALVAMKIAKFAEGLGLVEGKLSLIKKIGIAGVIYGTIELVKELIGYFSNLDTSLENNGTSWVGFGNIVKSIGIIIGSIGAIIGSVPLAIAGAITFIVGLVIKNWDKIKELLQNGIDWLIGQVDWVREHFGLIGEAIYTIFTSMLQTVLNITDIVFKTIKNVFDNILMIFKNIFNGDFKAVLENLKNIFVSIFNGIKGVILNVLNYIKNIFTTIFNGIWNTIKGFINLIIKGLNILIRGINKIKFDVPDWVPVIGGQRWGFYIREIPLLAKGGVVAKPTMAVIGEQGKEAVMPLENNLEWIDVLASKIASKIGNAEGGAYIINLDGRTIQRGIAKRVREISFATNGRYQ